MKQTSVWIPCPTRALAFAGAFLEEWGLTVTQSPEDADCLLLPVPFLGEPPRDLPHGIPVYGGRLAEDQFPGHICRDFLKDEAYLVPNAELTARCAIRQAEETLPRSWKNCPVLVTGFGRIGASLLRNLSGLGARTTVCLRNSSAAAALGALGVDTLNPTRAASQLSRFRVILNTVPAPLFSAADTERCPQNTVLLDLASVPGMEGPRVISARGLPGKRMPESAGSLIARTVLRYLALEEAEL